MKNMTNLLTATNSYLFVDCLNILKDNMRSYFQYLLLVQSSEEAKKEKEEKKRYLIRKVIYIIFLVSKPTRNKQLFSSPCRRQCELLPSLGVRRPSSVNFSHFNLLL